MNIRLLTGLFAFLISGLAISQESSNKKYSLTGYISNMQSVILDSLKGDWVTDNLFHNRLNFFFYPNEKVVFSVQVRNRFMYGGTVRYSQGYAEAIDKDNGYMDLSMNIFNENSFFLNSSIDRIYLQFTRKKFVTTIGRQRINWGISSVWNPNDIFNVQNYFDFDYIEKPGSDAIRFQYYTGPASNLELAAKLDRKGKLTAAILYKFSKGGYDMQFLGGVLEEEDFVAGLGWSGDINNIGFKGEMSYFHPAEASKDTSGTFLFSLGGDYMFANSLFVQIEALYSKLPSGQSISDFLNWYQGTLNVKNLSFTEFSLFSSLSYPFTPLFNGSIAGMYFPEFNGFFAGPNIDYSLSDNMQISLIMQVFSGKLPDPDTLINERKNLLMGFLRYKLNF